LTNEAVALLKDSSLISIIGLAELTRVGRETASNSGSPVTIVLAVAVLYLAMTLPLTYLVRRLEDKWQPISTPRARIRSEEVLQQGA
jgi:ABC-type amino acid transport system permease subunit